MPVSASGTAHPLLEKRLMLPKRQPSGHHILVYLLALVVVSVLLVAASLLLRGLLHRGAL